MGYTIYLVDKNKSVDESDIDAIIEKLPERLQGISKIGKQGWGWSLATDLSIVEGDVNHLKVSGSFSMSGEYAEDMTKTLQRLGKELGYNFDIITSDFNINNTSEKT